MNSLSPELIKEWNTVLEECHSFAFLVRDSDLQKEACGKLAELLDRIHGLKKAAIASQNEDEANFLLGYECAINCMRAELAMWLKLKANEPDAAWDDLVDAQMAAIDAVRAHTGFAELENYAQRLHAIKKLIFPEQVFLSVGMTVHRRECSICGQEYGECSHLVGKPYSGEICHTICTRVDLDNIAIVDEPANRKCRIRYFSVPEGKRSRMTWKIEPSQPGGEDVSEM